MLLFYFFTYFCHFSLRKRPQSGINNYTKKIALVAESFDDLNQTISTFNNRFTELKRFEFYYKNIIKSGILSTLLRTIQDESFEKLLTKINFKFYISGAVEFINDYDKKDQEEYLKNYVLDSGLQVKKRTRIEEGEEVDRFFLARNDPTMGLLFAVIFKRSSEVQEDPSNCEESDDEDVSSKKYKASWNLS